MRSTRISTAARSSPASRSLSQHVSRKPQRIPPPRSRAEYNGAILAAENRLASEPPTANAPATAGIDVHVFEQFGDLVSESWVKRVVERTLTTATGVVEDLPSVDVAIVDDDDVRRLNGRYRGLDETTDVLSFSFNQVDSHGYPGEEAARELDFVAAPGIRPVLGEVVVSYPEAARQAQELGHGIDRELGHLLAHGVLHLLGHDHEGQDERLAMEALETRVLSQVFDSG